MHLTYSLAEEDIVSLAEFQLEESGWLRKQARLRRILYPLGFGFLGLGFFLMSDDLILLLVFGLLALISFFMVPTMYSGLAQRRLPRIVSAKISSTSVGDRTISVSEEGLQQRAGELYSEVPWSLLHNVSETANHVFVAIDGIYSLVIPKKQVDADELNRFVELLGQKIQEADG